MDPILIAVTFALVAGVFGWFGYVFIRNSYALYKLLKYIHNSPNTRKQFEDDFYKKTIIEFLVFNCFKYETRLYYITAKVGFQMADADEDDPGWWERVSLVEGTKKYITDEQKAFVRKNIFNLKD